jgi:hypothetical protein
MQIMERKVPNRGLCFGYFTAAELSWLEITVKHLKNLTPMAADLLFPVSPRFYDTAVETG